MELKTSIWITNPPENNIRVIDQRFLPFEVKTLDLKTSNDIFFAIREMVVRGAPLIGVTAAYGMYLAIDECLKGDFEAQFIKKAGYLKSARPTAVNLAINVDEMAGFILKLKHKKNLKLLAFEKANQIRQKEIDFSNNIGEHGVNLIEHIYKSKQKQVNVLTHCNAGWLACVEWGTATAPIYKAHRKGIPVHVWVDETRPRNQGARLTAFELGMAGIPHTVIPDNTGGHLMQHGLVDLIFVGSDRTTIKGDVANKIGTYLKALAAFDNNIPFYVAFPSSSIDWDIENGLTDIPIEERDEKEVSEIEGWTGQKIEKIRLVPENSRTVNFGFDVTPARLITGLITERGICKADKKSILKLFPEKIIK